MANFTTFDSGIKIVSGSPAEGGQVLNDNFTIINTHIDNDNIHRQINDVEVASTSLWSSEKIKNYVDSGISGIVLDSFVYISSLAPDGDDDENNTGGNGTFSKGSLWYDSSNTELYILTDETAGSAAWRRIPILNENGELEGPIFLRETTGSDIPADGEIVIDGNNILRIGDNATTNGVAVTHTQNTDTGTTNARFSINSANQTISTGFNGSLQVGVSNTQSLAAASIQSGTSNTQFQGSSNNFQTGTSNTQGPSSSNNIQVGTNNSQFSKNSAQIGSSNSQTGNGQSGSGLQVGVSLNDGGRDNVIMFGLSKTAIVPSVFYCWLDNGIRLKPVSAAPSTPEEGTIYYDSDDDTLYVYANSAWQPLNGVSEHTHDASDIIYGAFADARISESSVTQHEAALSIDASQISNLPSGGSMPPIVFSALNSVAPSSNFATLDTRNNHPVLDFAEGVDELVYFYGVLPSTYAGGGLTVKLYWMSTTATTGEVAWNVAFERLNGDLDSTSFATEKGNLSSVNATSGILITATINFLNSEIDGLQAGEPFRIYVLRGGFLFPDNMTGDAELFLVEITET